MNPLKRIGSMAANFLLWAFFLSSSAVLYIGAVLIRLVTGPFDPNLKILQQYSCFWASLYIWVNPFWSLTKKGVKPAGGKSYVIISNHQSMADILVVFNSFLHFKWVSKKEMFKVPLIGWNMSLNGYVAIDRGNPQSREICMRECRRWLEKGSSVLFFPEGTRSKDGTLLPFKIGAFRLALEAGCDILPIVIRGSLHAIPKHSLLLHGKSNMELEFLPPVSVAPFKNKPLEESAQALSDQIRAQIHSKLAG